MQKIDRFLIIFIFILSLGISFAYLQFGYIFPAQSGDSFYYNEAVLSFIKNGEFFSNSIVARSGPGYPFFLTVIYKVFGLENYAAVRIFQILLLAGIGVLVFLIARNFLNLSPLFAFLSSLTLIFWPYLIVWSSLVLTEILFIFLLTLSILFILRFQKNQGFRNSLLSGLTLGLATLIRPEIIFLPIWLFFLWFIFKRQRQDFKISLKKVVLVIMIFSLVLSPWLIKNAVLFKNPLPVYSFLRWTDESEGEKENLSSYLQGKIVEKPVLIAKNMIYFWNPGTQGLRAEALIERYPSAEFLFLFYKILFFIILGTAFTSLFFIKKKRLLLFWAIISYYWLVHGLIFPSPRHTLPIIPLVILLAWMSLEMLYRFFRFKFSK
ncbi:MAG: glycosyltransferase family 39 protein [Candidatus Nealsonbacteria bacterium]